MFQWNSEFYSSEWNSVQNCVGSWRICSRENRAPYSKGNTADECDTEPRTHLQWIPACGNLRVYFMAHGNDAACLTPLEKKIFGAPKDQAKLTDYFKTWFSKLCSFLCVNTGVRNVIMSQCPRELWHHPHYNKYPSIMNVFLVPLRFFILGFYCILRRLRFLTLKMSIQGEDMYYTSLSTSGEGHVEIIWECYEGCRCIYEFRQTPGSELSDIFRKLCSDVYAEDGNLPFLKYRWVAFARQVS